MEIPQVNIKDYDYVLPGHRIAQHPLQDRPAARMLVYRKGKIHHHRFRDLPDQLPPQSRLFFNDTRVIPARIVIEKETGARIELFLLDPVEPVTVEQAMMAQGRTTWRVMVGNKKRWREGQTLRWQPAQSANPNQTLIMQVEWANRDRDEVTFSWSPQQLPFARIVEDVGAVPIPPYLHRDPEVSDTTDYQTVYARIQGAVAAPTAGLHFDKPLLEQLKQSFGMHFLTLHVGAGTFQPVKSDNLAEHTMHEERMHIPLEVVQSLAQPHAGPVIAIGTTAMRTLESLYWYALKRLRHGQEAFFVEKLDPYELAEEAGRAENASDKLMQELAALMDEHGSSALQGSTELLIMPGYPMQICQGLVTNFHQPGSTLLALVAACTGSDWKKIYREAMEQDYRFLSYGDGSLLFL